MTTSDLHQRFGELVGETRLSLRLTPAGLGELAGVDAETISRIEAGAPATRDQADRLIEILEAYQKPEAEKNIDDLDVPDLDDLSIFKTDDEIEAFYQELLAKSPAAAQLFKERRKVLSCFCLSDYRAAVAREQRIDEMRKLRADGFMSSV